MVAVRLWCRLFGRGLRFPIEIDDQRTVEDVVQMIHETPEVNGWPALVFVAKHEDGWMANVNVAALYGRIPPTCEDTRSRQYLLNTVVDTVGRSFEAPENTIQFIVQLQLEGESWLPPALFARRTIGEDVGMAMLWGHSPLQDAGSELPGLKELRRVLKQSLPVRVNVGRHVKNLFADKAPPVTCTDLAVEIEAFLLKLAAGPDHRSSSEDSWHAVYDNLLGITTQMCSANGMEIDHVRNVVDPFGTTENRLRTDGIVGCEGTAMFRMEEKRQHVSLMGPLRELTKKMKPWEAFYYGDLSYILGCATSGGKLEFVTINRSRRATVVMEISVFDNNGADAIKAFYNLAFVFDRMVAASKRTLQGRWMGRYLPAPLKQNRFRTIEVVGNTMQRHYHRAPLGDENYDRLKGIYMQLKEIKRGTIRRMLWPRRSHLQRVKKLETLYDNGMIETGFMVQLRPLGYHRMPETERQLYKWLKGILTALSTWHGFGYCHGDVGWSNIVYDPKSDNWFLIDMDKSYKTTAPTHITWQHFSRSHEARHQDDLYHLGVLLNIAAARVEFTAQLLTEQIREVQAAITAPTIRESTHTAANLRSRMTFTM